MFLYFQLKQEGFTQHYHKRSNAESTSKNLTAQKNELLCKVIAHNIIVIIHEMHELGIVPEFCTQSPLPAPKVVSI